MVVDGLTDWLLLRLLVGEHLHGVSFALQRLEVRLSLPKKSVFPGLCYNQHEGGYGSTNEMELWVVSIRFLKV